MGTISQMAEKCQKCPKRDKCDHKRMEMCAYIDDSQIAMSAGVSAGVSAAAPALRETMQINVGGAMTTVYKDEIEKEIYKALREPFMLNYGA
ncbi:MAG: hypothetical protein K2O40_13355 [Lachnospiraceae bacterium]|nr:hypothetical protein [Lachnospiraceae bacterium]